MFNNAMASDDTVGQTKPPLQYPLAQVSISVLHQTSRGIPGDYQIDIHGDGKAFYRQNADEKTLQADLQISSAALLDLLNDFYRIHFFELADTYAVTQQVKLLDNTTIATTAMKMADMNSKRLCIQLADYKKCVTIVNGQPAEAAQLVKKIEDLFVRS